MDKIRDFLKGKKTYLVALSGMLAALIAFASGEMTLPETVAAITAAVMAMTMRAGVEKSGPNKPAMLLAMLLPLVLASCAMSPGQKYKAQCLELDARQTNLIELREGGYLTTADRQQVTQLTDRADSLLDRARDAILDSRGWTIDYLIIEVDTILDDLLRIQIQAEASKEQEQRTDD